MLKLNLASQHWHQVVHHLPHSSRFYVAASVYMTLPSAMLSAWQSICHTSHNTGAIYHAYNIGEYNIFYRLEEAMLRTWWKLTYTSNNFFFMRTLENIVLLINLYFFYITAVHMGLELIQGIFDCIWAFIFVCIVYIQNYSYYMFTYKLICVVYLCILSLKWYIKHYFSGSVLRCVAIKYILSAKV